ncbi:MAG: hypothetical protein AAF632_20235 [Bacteroidota bacterium]
MYLKTTTNTIFFHVDPIQTDVINLNSLTLKAWFEPLPIGLESATREEWEEALDQLCNAKVNMGVVADS